MNGNKQFYVTYYYYQTKINLFIIRITAAEEQYHNKTLCTSNYYNKQEKEFDL